MAALGTKSLGSNSKTARATQRVIICIYLSSIVLQSSGAAEHGRRGPAGPGQGPSIRILKSFEHDESPMGPGTSLPLEASKPSLQLPVDSGQMGSYRSNKDAHRFPSNRSSLSLRAAQGFLAGCEQQGRISDLPSDTPSLKRYTRPGMPTHAHARW